MTLEHIAARIKRRTTRHGLYEGTAHHRQRDDPLLYVERQQYLAALRAVVAGAETARVVLARARQRLERRR
jgi:hypothetical protein